MCGADTHITPQALLWHLPPSPTENTEVGRRQVSPGSAPHIDNYSIWLLISLPVLAHALAVARAQLNVSACAVIPTLLAYSRTCSSLLPRCFLPHPVFPLPAVSPQMSSMSDTPSRDSQ